MRFFSSALFALFVSVTLAHSEDSAVAQKHLAIIKSIGAEGTGNAEAAAAWKSLVGLGGDALMPTFAAMDDAKPVAANWLRLAAQAIVEAERHADRPLSMAKLEGFVKDTKHAPVSRRLAYDFLVEADPKAPERLLPAMIEDPSVEIRLDAIASAIEKATPLLKSDPKKAAIESEKLFHASRDQDQTETSKPFKVLASFSV